MDTPLATYMRREGVKDADIALLIGRDRSVVSRIRRGLLRPTLDVAAEIEAKTKGEVSIASWFAKPRRTRTDGVAA